MIKRSRKQQQANALSREANMDAGSDKVIESASEKKKENGKLVSIRIPLDLYETLEDYQFSPANSDRLNRSKIIVRALEEYFHRLQ